MNFWGINSESRALIWNELPSGVKRGRLVGVWTPRVEHAEGHPRLVALVILRAFFGTQKIMKTFERVIIIFMTITHLNFAHIVI